MFCPSFLASVMWGERSAATSMVCFCIGNGVFLCHCFQDSSPPLIATCMTVTCLGQDMFWVHPIWHTLSFLSPQICVFCQIWNVFSQYFFKHFFSLSFFLPSFQSSSDTSISSFVVVTQLPESPIILTLFSPAVKTGWLWRSFSSLLFPSDLSIRLLSPSLGFSFGLLYSEVLKF